MIKMNQEEEVELWVGRAYFNGALQAISDAFHHNCKTIDNTTHRKSTISDKLEDYLGSHELIFILVAIPIMMVVGIILILLVCMLFEYLM